MDLGLTGVPVLVCGASRGIGFAVAERLVSEGAKVAMCSRDLAALQDAASRLHGKGAHAPVVISADLSLEGDVKMAVEQAAEMLGGLQVLVTNAGGPPPGGAAERTDEQWQAALELNFFSVVRLVRQALPHLTENPWSRVVAITSSAAKQPIEGLALSNSARAATHAYLKSISRQVGSQGVTVNAVMPYNILTDRIRALNAAPPDAGPDDRVFSHLIAESALGRLGEPAEIAALVVFLCSQVASYITGTSIPVDGGAARSLF